MMGRVLLLIVMLSVIAFGCKEQTESTVTTAQTPATTQQQTTDAEREALLSQWPPVDVQPMRLDFGRVPLGVPQTKQIELTNIGDKPLRITASRSNCGCTTADLSGTVVQPGEPVSFDIHFDAEGVTGNRSSEVTLVFAGYPRPVKFGIVAHVLKDGEE